MIPQGKQPHLSDCTKIELLPFNHSCTTFDPRAALEQNNVFRLMFFPRQAKGSVTCRHLLVALGKLHPKVSVGRTNQLQQLGSIRIQLQQASDWSNVAGGVRRVNGHERRLRRRRGLVGLLSFLLFRQRVLACRRGVFSEQRASKPTETSVNESAGQLTLPPPRALLLTVCKLYPAQRGRGGDPGIPRVSLLVSWCFEPSQPQRITSGLKTNFSSSPSYSLNKS